MIIIGIDPGIGRCGFGVVDKQRNHYSLVDFGCIETKSSLEQIDRILILKEKLDQVIIKYKPDLAVVEQLFFFKNQKTIIQVGQARGVILLALAEAKIPTSELTPLQVKMSLTGYGKAEKTQIQKMVKLILKLDSIPKPDDAADALAIALSIK